MFSNLFFNYCNYLSTLDLNYLYLLSSDRRLIIYYDSFFFLPAEGVRSTRSNMAFLALLANCKVEKVSAEAVTEGLIHIMNLIFPCPRRESLKILVSFEFLKGICVLDF